MVIVTILAKTNPCTVYFDHPIREPKYVRLLSASLFNSWYNLKNQGLIYFGKNKNEYVGFLPGHYSLETLAHEIKRLTDVFDVKLETKINDPRGQMLIKYTDDKHVEFDDNLASFLGVKKLEKYDNYTIVKRVNSPTTYFVYCDLVDREKNLMNGKPSSVLTSFAVRGQPFEKVSYQPESIPSTRRVPFGLIANSLTISVKDEDNGLFDFNGLPIEFEIEIN